MNRGAARQPDIDRLRGLVIVLMSLDHVRDYWSPTPFAPEDLAQSDPALFLTRWITHFCAPIFVFLAGTSAWLQQQARALDRPALGRFLAVRGIWLILLELVLVNPAWDGRPFSFFLLQVIWAIGWAMLALAVLVQGPRWLPLLVGLLIVSGHNLLDAVQPADLGSASWLWILLHDGGWLAEDWAGGILVAYPVLPWIGVMALGYGASPWLAGPARSDRRLLIAGAVALLAFLLLRLGNLYGEPSQWRVDARGLGWSMLAALNVEKYPPSLQFVLMTLGPALIALVLLARPPGRWLRPLEVFGRVPLFFYLLHLPLISASALLWGHLVFGQAVDFYIGPGGVPEGYAPSLPRAWMVWALVLLALYPLCLGYDHYKRAHPEKSWLRLL